MDRLNRRNWDLTRIALDLTIGVLAVGAIILAASGLMPGNPAFYAAMGLVVWGLVTVLRVVGRPDRTPLAGGIGAVALVASVIGAIWLFNVAWDAFG